MPLLASSSEADLSAGLRAFLDEHLPIPELRTWDPWDRSRGRQLWRSVAEAGWVSAADNIQSLGANFSDLALAHMQVGKSLSPLPWIEVSIFARHVIHEALSDEALELKARIDSGEDVLMPIALRGTPDVSLHRDGVRVRGAAPVAAHAHVADYFLLDLPSHGPVVVPADSAGLAIRPRPNISRYPLFEVVLRDVHVVKDHLLAVAGVGGSTWNSARARAVTVLCSHVAGAGQRLLELALSYSNSRVQFSRPIGAFEAVQRLCCDIAIAQHELELFTRWGADRIDVGQGDDSNESMVRYAASAARLMPEAAHEVFAGAGFMLESEVQMFSSRMKRWEMLLRQEQRRLTNSLRPGGVET